MNLKKKFFFFLSNIRKVTNLCFAYGSYSTEIFQDNSKTESVREELKYFYLSY